MSALRLPARFARAIVLALSIVAAASAAGAQPPQKPLSGASIPKFVDPLPIFAGQRVGGPSVTVKMQESTQQVLPSSVYARLPARFRAGTQVWAYQVSGQDAVTGAPVARKPNYPGITVEATRGVPTTVVYVNDLSTPALQQTLPVDQTIDWADPLGLGCTFQDPMSKACMRQYSGPVPTVVHLHGSEVPPAFDGGPDAWFTVDGRHGSNYGTLQPIGANKAMYRYPNSQEASTLWFHDHALGTTRLNVFGGIAAMYFLRDGDDTGRADNPLRLPAGDQELELVIQDRAFDVDGQLMYSDPTQIANADVHPFWRPEFFGDVIVVNGKSWPRLDAEPRRYRFRVLNGSNARFYHLALSNASGGAAPKLWQIGTEGGRLDAPVALDALQLAPGERADLLVDFSAFPGATFTVTNDANAPFPGGDPVDPDTTAQVMQIRVGARASSPDRSCDPAATGPSACRLRTGHAIVRLADAAAADVAAGVKVDATRQLILREIEGPNGPLNVFVNNTTYKGFKQSTRASTSAPQPVSGAIGLGANFVTEAPRVGSTEIWEVANLTEDAHPIHVHLVQFQILSRQDMNTGRDENTDAPFGYFADWLARLPGGDAAPGDGPPAAYGTPNADGALGGNLAFSPYLLGSRAAPAVNERGWKDTVVMYPATVTRIAVRWAPQGAPLDTVRAGVNRYPFDPALTDRGARDAAGNPGAAGYAFHCHILEHEDNEMMRPYAVVR
jgi:FtsP/CotA-like multicopper oxidase with cupredoxin domain